MVSRAALAALRPRHVPLLTEAYPPRQGGLLKVGWERGGAQAASAVAP